MKAVELINVSKLSEVLTENPTYLRLGGLNERVPEHFKQQVQELLSYIDNWLLKWDKRKVEVDLFEQFETLPQRVKDVICIYNESTNYEELDEMIEELELLGYTCEYSLDYVPFNLKKI